MPFLHPNCLSALPLAIVIASLALILPILLITELSASTTRSEDYSGQEHVVLRRPPVQPGIGISLNYDYVAAGIYFENGTSVPVAHIDGDAVYRSFMRTTRTGHGCAPMNSTSQVYTTVDESESLARMLRQLKASIASRLDEPFRFVVASRPDHKCHTASDSFGQWHAHQTEVLDSALSKVGLYLAQDRMIHAGFASVIANHMIGGNVEKDGFVISIDRGHYGWRYSLLYLDEGLGDLGFDTSFVHDTGEPSPQRDAARDALREFLEIAEGFDDEFALDEVIELVVSGDLASDADFQDDLVSVLGSELVTKARVRDPIHASAIGAAGMCFSSLLSQ
ncbi:unnamed protein product [Clonostachys solani]|uniref:Uncharacterized protein n=1 Tax=Clonostachys solani TaxID=160281 RepID=A0A9P0EH52_9HYPO|nr:unnamed protein product [Clonostachys solani]